MVCFLATVMTDTSENTQPKQWALTKPLSSNCPNGKIYQKKIVPTITDRTTTTPGALMYVNIFSISTPSLLQKHWISLFVDNYTDCCISKFVPLNRSVLNIVGLSILHEDLVLKGIRVQPICCGRR